MKISEIKKRLSEAVEKGLKDRFIEAALRDRMSDWYDNERLSDTLYYVLDDAGELSEELSEEIGKFVLDVCEKIEQTLSSAVPKVIDEAFKRRSALNEL